MSAERLYATPSWGAVTLEQLRMLTLLQRRDFIAIAVIGGLLVALALYGLLNAQFTTSGPIQVDVFRMFRLPLVLVGALWPLGVWRHGTPAQRGYFWALPVARGPHTLLRVGLGWVLLMGVSLVVMAVGALVVAAYGARFGAPTLVFSYWYGPLLTASLAYLLVSALAVQLDSPVRWAIWGTIAVFGLRVIAAATALWTLGDSIDFVVGSFRNALAGPFGTQPWATSYLAWLAVAALATVVGAFRHQES